MSSNPAYDPPAVSLNVLFDGQSVATPTFVTNHDISDMRWDLHEYTAQASGSSSALEFVSLTPGCCGPVIDAVDLELVDTTAPVVACVAGPNPSGKNTPRASNQDGFFTVT